MITGRSTLTSFTSGSGKRCLSVRRPVILSGNGLPQIVEQVIRPTGLLDPEVLVKPTDGQIDDLISEINLRTAKGQRVLVTTLTKKMAEDLSQYLENMGIRIRYMHHDIDTRTDGDYP